MTQRLLFFIAMASLIESLIVEFCGLLRDLWRWFWKGKTPPQEFPYVAVGSLLTPAEVSFYHVLRSVVDAQHCICPKVRVADLLNVTVREKSYGPRNRIDRKHVDFVLCDQATMQPLLVIELDDSSHQERRRQERDEFLDRAFSAAALPVLRVRCRRAYRPAELRDEIRAFIG